MSGALDHGGAGQDLEGVSPGQWVRSGETGCDR